MNDNHTENTPVTHEVKEEKPVATTLVEALIEVQKELKPALRDATNPHFKAPYATLESCWESSRHALSANGFAVSNRTEFQGKDVWVVTSLIHKSGESLETRLPVINDRGNMQGLGSALTYARRYGLMALVGICPEDDDGNLSGERSSPAPKNERAPQKNEKGAAPNKKKEPPKVKKEKEPERYEGQHADMGTFWGLWKKNGYSEEDWRAHLKTVNVSSTKDLTQVQMKALITDLKRQLGEDA